MSGTVYWSYPILPFGIVACTFFSDNLSRNSCILKRIIRIGLGIVEKRRRLLPGQIFREACLYLYKRLSFLIKKMYNNIQIFISGGWLLVSNIVIGSTSPSQLPVKTSYRGITSDQMVLTKTAMNELRSLACLSPSWVSTAVKRTDVRSTWPLLITSLVKP